MTDNRIKKVRAEIERRVKFHAESSEPLASAYVSEDNAILSFIDSLQEEPKKCMYSKDNYTNEDRKVLCDGCEEECKYAQKEEPVSEELEESAWFYADKKACLDKSIFTQKEINEKRSKSEYNWEDIRTAFKAGAQWQKSHLWKSADGDDLPEYDREVIALEGIVDPTAIDCLCGYKVIFAHRPNPNGWDGMSFTTGEVEHYTPKTYGEGGWNIPNIVYWLDVKLPKEIEL